MITLSHTLSQADGWDVSEDLLKPARGMLFGLELSAYFWAVLIGLSI